MRTVILFGTWIILGATVASFATEQTGLKEEAIQYEAEQPPILWRDFIKGRSAAPVRSDEEEGVPNSGPAATGGLLDGATLGFCAAERRRTTGGHRV